MRVIEVDTMKLVEKQVAPTFTAAMITEGRPGLPL